MDKNFYGSALWGGMIFLGVALGFILQEAVGLDYGMAVGVIGFMGLAMLLRWWTTRRVGS